MGRWSKKRGRPSRPSGDDDADPVHLDGEDNAWWSQTDVQEVWHPRPPGRGEREPAEERDILAKHFGDDWRDTFGFTPSNDEELAAEEAREPPAHLDQDPYEVLQVDPTASWEEIVEAHRHQARLHHPDRLFGQSDEEKAEGEERIRVINAAYQELQIRRGR